MMNSSSSPGKPPRHGDASVRDRKQDLTSSLDETNGQGRPTEEEPPTPKRRPHILYIGPKSGSTGNVVEDLESSNCTVETKYIYTGNLANLNLRHVHHDMIFIDFKDYDVYDFLIAFEYVKSLSQGDIICLCRKAAFKRREWIFSAKNTEALLWPYSRQALLDKLRRHLLDFNITDPVSGSLIQNDLPEHDSYQKKVWRIQGWQARIGLLAIHRGQRPWSVFESHGNMQGEDFNHPHQLTIHWKPQKHGLIDMFGADMSQLTNEVDMFGNSLNREQEDLFVKQLAKALYENVQELTIAESSVQSLMSDFGEMLIDFAKRLYQEWSSREFQQVMSWVCRLVLDIVNSFFDMAGAGAHHRPDSSSGNLPLNERVNRGFDTNNSQSEVIPTAAPRNLYADHLLLKELAFHQFPNGFETYVEEVRRSESYCWLISKLRSRLALDWEVHECQSIRRFIMGFLPGALAMNPPQTLPTLPKANCTFQFWWPVVEILRGQLPAQFSAAELRNVVTLTGSPSDAQALPCETYLQQTWPCVGADLMDVLESALTQEKSTATVHCRDLTEIDAQFEGGHWRVAVFGMPESVVDVAQALAWLGAAIRLPLPGKGIVPCLSLLRQVPSRNSFLLPEDAKTNTSTVADSTRPDARGFTHTFYLEWDLKDSSIVTPYSLCWQKLFENCCIVQGFPIPRRPEQGLGLEIPLNMMAGLIGARYLHEYNAKVYIKGFSALLLPTKKLSGLLVWHMVCNDSGDHVSYDDYAGGVEIGTADVEGQRHIVGWCTKTINSIGVIQSDFENPRPSELPEVRPGGVLDNFCLTFGKAITQEPSFTLLKSQKSLHIASGTYLAKFKYLSSRFGLLWDVELNRGFLSDFLKVFLHLLGSFVHAYQEPIKAELIRMYQSVSEVASCVSVAPIPSHTANISSTAWPTIPVEPEDDEEVAALRGAANSIFESYADQLYDTMDKLVTYQDKMEHEDERRLCRSLKLLEGWDFQDLTIQHGPKRARVMQLPTVAFTWARMLRNLRAVTFFGQEFGNLLKPGLPTNDNGCGNLASESFHIAATLQDLKPAMRFSSKYASGLLDLGRGNFTSLLSAGSLFDHCKCSDEQNNGQTKISSTHMPWPSKNLKLLTNISSQGENTKPKWSSYLERYPTGAIILGHDDQFGWYLNDLGEPVKGRPPTPSFEMEESFEDSGIGSSLSPPSNKDNVRSERLLFSNAEPFSDGPVQSDRDDKGIGEQFGFSKDHNVILRPDPPTQTDPGGTSQRKTPGLGQVAIFRSKLEVPQSDNVHDPHKEVHVLEAVPATSSSRHPKVRKREPPYKNKNPASGDSHRERRGV